MQAGGLPGIKDFIFRKGTPVNYDCDLSEKCGITDVDLSVALELTERFIGILRSRGEYSGIDKLPSM